MDGSKSANIGRFLRAASQPARLVERYEDDGVEVIVTERSLGPGSAVRAILRSGDDYVVVDRVTNTPATIRWLFAPDAENLVQVLSPTPPYSAIRQSDDPTSGWWSPHYGERERAVAQVVELADGETTVLLVPASDTSSLSVERIRDALARYSLLANGIAPYMANSEVPSAP
jgi:hypothetical protein